jgi:hypothetical protein
VSDPLRVRGLRSLRGARRRVPMSDILYLCEVLKHPKGVLVASQHLRGHFF